MSWGGARVGSGQKPKGERAIRPRTPVVALPGGKVDEEGIPALPPEDLPVDQREFWQRNVPRALAQGTLTPRTVEAFRMLCELDAERRATKRTIDEQGRTYIKAWTDSSGQEHEELKAHPMVARYDRLSKQVESLLARFKLAPFGKAEAVVKAKTPENRWAGIARKA